MGHGQTHPAADQNGACRRPCSERNPPIRGAVRAPFLRPRTGSLLPAPVRKRRRVGGFKGPSVSAHGAAHVRGGVSTAGEPRVPPHRPARHAHADRHRVGRRHPARNPRLPADPHQQHEVGGQPLFQRPRRGGDGGEVRQAQGAQPEGRASPQHSQRGHRHRGSHGQRRQRLERAVSGVGQPHHLAVAAQLRADARHPGLGQPRGGRHPAQRAPEVRRAAGAALSGGGDSGSGRVPGRRAARFPCTCVPTSGAPTPGSTGSC